MIWQKEGNLILFIVTFTVVLLSNSKLNGESIDNYDYEDYRIETGGYYIKFLTQYTEYPITLKDKLGGTQKDYITKWYKHGSSCNLEELDNYQKYFKINKQENGATDIQIIDYDRKNNLILDHYEPTQVHSAAEDDIEHNYDYADEKSRVIYTLAYLNSFKMEVDDSSADKIELTCKAKFLLPVGIVYDHTSILNEQLEKAIELKLNMISRSTYNFGKDAIEDKKFELDELEKNATESSEIDYKVTERIVNKPAKKHGRDANVLKVSHNQRSEITLYELEIVDGPISLYKGETEEGAGANFSCHLTLVDYDETFAFDSIIHEYVRFNKGADRVQITDNNNNNNNSSAVNSSSVFGTIFLSILSLSYYFLKRLFL